MLTYISLFSSAGVGCCGFSREGFECIATNELIARRLDVQRFNNKCKYESGYICGDITKDETKELLFRELDLWKRKENVSRPDVIIATPPCQGMSVANLKKKSDEIVRNSLVVESIKLIREIRPRFFIFENVPAFMNTACTDTDGQAKPISQAIRSGLGDLYSYTSRVINFKDHGACSSRRRTLVIGVSLDIANEISPLELYPPLTGAKTLREVIGHLKPLTKPAEVDPDDIYHAFRPYPEHMRAWIHDLKEGCSAFDNEDDEKKPHRVVDGRIVINARKNGDKYQRVFWDKVGPCIHTRNDQLASQNTIHPADDRVFSIRELMLMMTVPADFRWTDKSLGELNAMSVEDKRAYLKKEGIKIRQSLGEAVPTVIFAQIARLIKSALQYPVLTSAKINSIITRYELTDTDNLIKFIEDDPLGLSPAALGRIAELSNTKRTENAAYCTGKPLITEMLTKLPDIDKPELRILEPSVGAGNFIPLIAHRYEGKKLIIDAVDIDPDSLRVLKALKKRFMLPDNVTLKLIADDFLTHEIDRRYDLVIGNPPFYKMSGTDKRLAEYRKNAVNKTTNNVCAFFLEKALTISDHTALVFPKFLLNTPEFAETRAHLQKKRVECIIDFGEKGFPGVLVETVAIFVKSGAAPASTRVISVTNKTDDKRRQKYIFDTSLPYWIIYRDEAFDRVCARLDLGVFTVFRDRQITNKLLSESGDIRVVKSRNITDGGKLINIAGYDAYISEEDAKDLAVYSYLDREDVYLTPNMTYNPRVIKKPRGVLVNGSVAVLLPKDGVTVTDEQLRFFSSSEYRHFYRIARNHQTRSLNVDRCSVFFYGLLKGAN